jgi:Trk-type K+ transport systems, membrane components
LQSIGTFTGKEPAFSHRRFTRDNINRALTLFFSAILLIILATLLLTMTQPSLGHNGVTKAVFEAVSAFGTVGLTLGLTPHLNLFGKNHYYGFDVYWTCWNLHFHVFYLQVTSYKTKLSLSRGGNYHWLIKVLLF